MKLQIFSLFAIISISLPVHASVYRSFEPCSRQELLKNRSDIPKIQSFLSCNRILSKNVSPIDKMRPIRAGFNYDKVERADFCVASLDGHRTNTEVVFNGALSYLIDNKNRVRKDIEASGEFIPAPRTHRHAFSLEVGEVRPTQDSIRIYQEMELGNSIDVQINRKDRVAQLEMIDKRENQRLSMRLACH